MPLALAEALAAAEATVAQFGHGEVPEPCGWRRDRRRTWHIWRFFGCGTLIDLGQVPCRLRRRVVYSLGMPRAVLENVRAQVLLCVLIGASIGYPLIIAYVSAARNSHPITPPILWSRWYHPLPLNACVGFLTLCLGSLQLGKDVVALPSVGRGRLLGGRVSLWGRLLVPAGAVSSGLDALSADGSRCDRLFAVPFQFLLGLAGAVGIAAVFLRSVEYTWQDETVDVLSFGILLATCVLGWRLSLLACTTADARLAHSPALLPLFLRNGAEPDPPLLHHLARHGRAAAPIPRDARHLERCRAN